MSLIATALTTLTEAKAHIRIDQASAQTVYAEPVGTGNGSNKTFTLDYTPITGSLRLYVNGSLQTETTHYSISETTITFVTAPTNGHIVTANYDTTPSADTFEEWDDDLLEAMINAATKFTENIANRAFIQRTVTENRTGDGMVYIRLYQLPVSSITSVTLDSTALTADTDYTAQLYRGVLRRDSKWTKEKTLVIVYVAGDCENLAAVRSSYPQAIDACLMILADLWDNRSAEASQITTQGVGAINYQAKSRAHRILYALDPTGGLL